MTATTTTPGLTATQPIVKDVVIAAPPETIWSYFTDPAKVSEWLGRDAQIEARPGGTVRVDFNGFDIMRGEMLEMQPYSRLVMSWGWETLADGTQPGGSRVEITLAPEDGGTRLRLVHSNFTAMERDSMDAGWSDLLGVMARQAEGAEPAMTPPVLSAADDLGARLNTALIHLRWAVEQCPADRWSAVTADEWSVGVTAHHMIGHLVVAQLARSIADGKPLEFADSGPEVLHEGNAEHARQFAAVTQQEVLGELKSAGPEAVTLVRGFSDADLDARAALRFLDGHEVSARQLLEGAMLGGIAEHMAHIEAATA